MTFGRGRARGAIEGRFGGWDEPMEPQIGAGKVIGPVGWCTIKKENKGKQDATKGRSSREAIEDSCLEPELK